MYEKYESSSILKDSRIYQLTFHPHGDVGAAVVAPWTLGRQQVASRGLEPGM